MLGRGTQRTDIEDARVAGIDASWCWEMYSCKFTRFCPQCFKCLEISILTTERAACERERRGSGGGCRGVPTKEFSECFVNL